ncbi:tRNA glutamyl-Q(34) synthetase GluQRS [Alphaproteobacteria bacterium GH1-50]|uniref:tRNA glutamyl-Q(34) synthetase GluQRS n=1 Tax=Kangsaoukella pontilimi TaxID=2691042 RepID=A0A7C9ND59_9RHOB|nr:tRNA glutamyl-Q(34) synthetase GluQRS [Kangsaoukella pontilimi]MXQ07199.1 tRNA glutamyl-Q(34) synthetase GluQRS [Kangsaoukella pontilimi]
MRTRFAPSPTGPLHLGHAYSAMLAHDMARAEGGDFLLRIEDIDQSRARPEWEELIFEDLAWLGIIWDGPVLRQSDRMDAYEAALTSLWRQGLLYPCTCTRRDIAEAASAPQEGAPLLGPDGVIYPGTCRPGWVVPPEMDLPRDVALRLDMGQAVARAFDHRVGKAGAERVAEFEETGHGPNGERGIMEIDARHMTREVGDVVLARRDMGTSYHLSVVLDDAAQGITHVIRGEDLFEATAIHVTLQRLLNLPTPIYHHHRLIRDEAGKRLAKRDDARAIRLYRDEGASPEDIRRMVGL